MLPFARCLLSSMIGLGLYAPVLAQPVNTPTSANSGKNCAQKSSTDDTFGCIPSNQQSKNINQLPITITADRAQAQADKMAIYQGDVVVKQGHRTLKADTITLRQPENQIDANGNILFHDGQMAISGTSMHADLQTNSSELNNAKYHLTCGPGRGEAEKVFKNGTVFYKLENGTYTTCPDADNSWRFSASGIEKKDGDIFADLYHPRFEVLNTPVVYFPYLRMPVEDGRLTGFLFPSVSLNGSNGLEIETPFYWNIHPQADMVITPRYMTNRGLFLTLEPRLLTRFGQSNVIAEYMGNDDLYSEESKSWGFQWKHAGLNRHWKYSTDISAVSDIGYFTRHTDSVVGSREDSTLLRSGEIAYRDYTWDSSLLVRDFQSLSPFVTAYRLLPQLNFNYYSDLKYGIDVTLPMQLSYFETDSKLKPNTTRFHVEPSLTLPYNRTWLSASAETKLMYTYYDQTNTKNVFGYNGERLEEMTSRTVPMAKLHGLVTLERNDSLFNYNYSQTLEPQLQYLYIKEVDQSNIYNPVHYSNGGYDTARQQTDYYGLFRANQFSSIDYINPANQFTIGATTRIFDSGYKERFNLAFGQIYYVDKPHSESDVTSNYSAWAIESELNLADQFFVKGSLEYDSNINELQFGNTTIEYRNDLFFAQSSYRYVSRNYIASTTGNQNLDLVTKNGISQIGVVSGFPITSKISFNAQYFHDTTQDIMLESLMQLTYRSSCWTIGLGYNEYLLSRSNINDLPKYENNISLSFSLLGLGTNTSFGYNSATGNALGYRSLFALKN